MGKADCNLAVNGILLVNKPQGLSSNAVLQKVRHIYHARKAGHTGSLDPLATGMLPVCFGEATKYCQYLLDADKSYVATGLLGIRTSTGDAQGEIISQTDNFEVTRQQLDQSIARFSGVIQQVPPMFSALKHNGTPLYRLARAGQTIERKAREVTVHQLELLDFDGRQFTIKVSCSKGTYIRSLIEDIGEVLGCGANVTVLHRLYTAGFDAEPMYELDELRQLNQEQLQERLLPLERAVQYMPLLQLNEMQITQLRQGRIISDSLSPQESGLYRIHNDKGQFVGLAEFDRQGSLKVKRFLAEPEKKIEQIIN
ncbi:tRNA pseudouridine(55) synthase TruB [Legionella dresdenensis]|uniref:tRNA pseudouridine synthase B n=1 Tax=Legionella dresdenensis TaxID=450200 RepID=A0ABV8CEZ1_9GAMM